MFVYMPVLHLTLKMYFVKQSKRSSNYYKMFQQLFSDTQMIYTFYKTLIKLFDISRQYAACNS